MEGVETAVKTSYIFYFIDLTLELCKYFYVIIKIN